MLIYTPTRPIWLQTLACIERAMYPRNATSVVNRTDKTDRASGSVFRANFRLLVGLVWQSDLVY